MENEDNLHENGSIDLIGAFYYTFLEEARNPVDP